MVLIRKYSLRFDANIITIFALRAFLNQRCYAKYILVIYSDCLKHFLPTVASYFIVEFATGFNIKMEITSSKYYELSFALVYSIEKRR